jgi:hypothetical protein
MSSGAVVVTSSGGMAWVAVGYDLDVPESVFEFDLDPSQIAMLGWTREPSMEYGYSLDRLSGSAPVERTEWDLCSAWITGDGRYSVRKSVNIDALWVIVLDLGAAVWSHD